MSSIREKCDALVRAYQAKGVDPSAELSPPACDAELQSVSEWFPASIPEPLQQLYQWRNGQPNDAWQTMAVFWFRDMQFTSLQRAEIEYRSMMETYGADDTENIKYSGIALKTSFPFASFNGGWYVLPCEPHTISRVHPLPVVSVM